MRKRSIIELTPLLDVILLLIFVFMINMQSSSDSMDKKYDELEASYEDAAEQNTQLEQENEDLQSRIYALEEENSELNEKVSQLTQQIGYEAAANDAERQSIQKAMEAFKELTGITDSELAGLLQSQEDASQVLNDMTDAEDIVLELYKYSYVMNKFFFVDVELVGADNRILINGEQIQVAVSSGDTQDTDTQHEKSIKIYDELQKTIDSRPGGAEMVMVTLIVRDPEVYQYAYEITWEALRELELRASGYRLYKTSYTYID